MHGLVGEYWRQWKTRFLLEIHVRPDDPRVVAIEKSVLFALGWMAAIVMAFGFYRWVCHVMTREVMDIEVDIACHVGSKTSGAYTTTGGGSVSTGWSDRATWTPWTRVPRSGP